MKRLLIIGAGFLQNYLIKKSKLMGYYTLTVDANSNAVGFSNADEWAVIDIINKEACLQYAQKNEIDGVVTAATDFGVITSAYIAEKMGLNGVSLEGAELIKNKYQVRKRLYENHVDDTSQSYEVCDNTDISKLTKRLIYPVMVKPCDGSGSRGTSRVDTSEQLRDACKCAINNSITRKAEIETFIQGKEYGAETLVVNGIPYVMAIIKKWMTDPPYYAELGHAIPSGLSKKIEEKMIQCIKRAICALGVQNGAVNMDILVTLEEKIYIVDIGARMGGNLIGSHIIPIGTGIDYMGNILRNAVGDSVDFNSKEKKCVTTRLLAFKDGIIKRLPDFDSYERKFGVKIEHHMNIGDIVHEYHTNIDGCGYIIATGLDPIETENRAAKAKEELANIIFEG